MSPYRTVSFKVVLIFLLLVTTFVAGSIRADLIAVDSNRSLYSINMTTGAKTLIGTVSANASTTAELTLDPFNNTIYLSSTGNDSLYTLDLATGTATLIGFYGDSNVVMHGLEFDSQHRHPLWRFFPQQRPLHY